MYSRRRLARSDRRGVRNSLRLGLALAISLTAFAAIGPASVGAYLYWANDGTDSIGRANLNGSGASQSFMIGLDSPLDVAVDATHIYWANNATGKIGRAKLDGTGKNRSFITTGSSVVRGLTVDAGHIYWSGSSIGRANIDGSSVDPTFITGVAGAYGLALDAGHIYWANHSTDTIGRANINGSTVSPSFITGAASPYGVAVDDLHLYWTNFGTSKIGRALVDGDVVDQAFIGGARSPWGIAVDAGHLYWTNFSTIGRAKLDGSGSDQEFIGGASGVTGMAVDSLLPPSTKLKSVAVNHAKRKASFRFGSSQPRSRFICSLDGKAFTACASPKVYKHLRKGRHTFKVKARNSQRALDPSPATKSFRI